MPRVVVFDETGGPEVLRIVDEPVVEPAAGEVRVRIEAFAVNPLDQMIRAGQSPRPIRLPHARLGVEGTGVIDALGAEVTGLAVGDPVILAALPDFEDKGAYAEYTTVLAGRVVPRPAGLGPVDAAALWVSYFTAYGALVEKGGMRPGDRVLITAASGGVGRAAIQIANQIGAVPIAVTRHTAREESLLAAGAAAVIATDRENVGEATRRHTGGAGADIILDAVMGPGLAELSLAAKLGGTLATVGWLDPRPASFPANPSLTIHRYMGFADMVDPVTVRRVAAFLAAGVRSGVLRPTIDRVFDFDDIVEAHRYLEKGTPSGKVVVTA
ncbi:NADPH:quinone reductase-like Zn-dependent oxidoreductase [Actinoplanes lutulentus]|uniref:NADPH:quinone reductase-like Zn-dependent oxidoreductase n=1 Tax=Actinoplanes lutulentus TaxID=1287878 RepID=A0A327Z3M7_9ACTN|nr:zinc-dependent alcohol dehydrogenase family protein [Actinoplanes lutulentus]MBB2947856.1 NADPH:quinone reductase-like Zn-dependent oxidoreductase [Actinoplanes lutulentus]RAK29831.1 NADPH:quinone reductase-like Zn-dependent oxidoreductase [Actinoplanes lutulentus]